MCLSIVCSEAFPRGVSGGRPHAVSARNTT
jgi:hypothetical protein